MKKIVAIVAVLTVVAFATVVLAQQASAPAPAPAPAKPAVTPAPAKPAVPAEKPKADKPKTTKTEKFSGTIEKVDEMAKSVVVKDKKGEMTFVIGDKSKIVKGGKDMPFAEVKQGMNASITYMKEGDKAMVDKMTVSAPKAAPAPKKEKTAEKPAETPKK
jgi:hypothetical protein